MMIALALAFVSDKHYHHNIYKNSAYISTHEQQNKYIRHTNDHICIHVRVRLHVHVHVRIVARDNKLILMDQ